MKTTHHKVLVVAMATAMLAATSAQAMEDQAGSFQAHLYSDTLMIEPLTDAAFGASVEVAIKGPDGNIQSQHFPAGELIEIDPSALPDGRYTYEAKIIALASPRIRGRDAAPSPAEQLHSVSGSFMVSGGQFVSPDVLEESTPVASKGKSATPSLQYEDSDGGDGPRDQVILDDLIVDGSACIGFDCANGESFGFDTLRLKENNLRIKFDDTSSAGSFPSNDWQLTANESTNGGANKFSIDDVTNSRTPFTIEAGTRSNQLYLADNNKVGFGTNLPVVDLHVKQGNTPTLRLEQDGSSGFAAQTFDVASNETNFFIRDATNGSTLPFRIQPGAPTNAIYIANDGDVGMGAGTSPDAPLHVQGTDGNTQLLVEESSTTNAVRTLLNLENNGGSRLRFENSATDDHDWLLTANTLGFAISEDFSGVQEFMLQAATGNLTIAGTLTQNSDRNRKTGITPVDPQSILERVADLPISTWAYIEDTNVVHLGPMAQDFYASFGLGEDERKIATIDTSGVALAAIQALKAQNDQKDEQISALRDEINRLKQRFERVDALERRLNEMQNLIANSSEPEATSLLHGRDESKASD